MLATGVGFPRKKYQAPSGNCACSERLRSSCPIDRPFVECRSFVRMRVAVWEDCNPALLAQFAPLSTRQGLGIVQESCMLMLSYPSSNQ